MTSVPDLTRLIARIAEWQEGHGQPGGRAEAARRLDEANKLLDEVANMLVDVRRDLLGRSDNRAYTGGRASMPRQDSELPSIGTNPVNLRQLAREARLNATMMTDDGAAGGLLEYAADLEARAAAMETEPGTLRPRRARRK